MLLLAAGCFTSVSQSAESPTEPPPTAAPIAAETALGASVTAFSVVGYPGTYTFDVTVRSPDIGCACYADWWEVVSTDGDLLYHRVLLHSHVDEQPFSRSGGPVPVNTNDTVIVRAHMSTTGYGGSALRGSVKIGFVALTTPPNFAAGLAEQAPLPSSCAF
jgi:hypothetical protein